MRKRIWIPCIVVLVVCLLLVLFRPTQHQTTTLPMQSVAPTNQLEQLEQPKVVEHHQITNISGIPPLPPSASPLAKSLAETNPLVARELALWQAPIEFYGKVIDENSNAVASAQVSFHWMEMPTTDGSRSSNTESDSEGLFSLHSALGPSLTVSVSKEGYYASRSTPDGFQYSLGNELFHPDSLNPVVFHLRKKGNGESLIQTDFPPGMQIAQLHHDGTPIELDLLNGTRVSAGSGQLKLEFWRDISNMNKQPFDWKLQFSAPGGGLVPTDEEFAFEAPENGYQSSIVIDMPATNQNWLGEIRRKYYIQLSNGNYGRIDFYLLPYNGVITVHSAINPSGSRNLEPKN